jgi:hypothetical protein
MAFSDDLRGLHLLAHCDNAAVVAAIKRNVASDDRLNCLLRFLHRVTGTISLRLSAAHIAGVHNVGADALSRNDLTSFLALPSPRPPVQVPVPAALRQSWWTSCGLPSTRA